MRNNWNVFCYYGNSAFSSALAMGDKGDLDWYLVPIFWFLFNFKMEMFWALFPRCNIVLVLGQMLYLFVRYLMESDSRCFRGNQ